MLAGAADKIEKRGERSFPLDLLADIQEIFNARGENLLRSAEIVDALVAAPDRPWAEWSKGRPISAHKLAKMLKRFGVSAERGRVGTQNPVSVYSRASFEPAWSRYFPADGLEQSDTVGTSDTSSEPYVNPYEDGDEF